MSTARSQLLPASVARPALGVMQPYFFPYLGYFSIIAAVDRWLAFDTVQYMRKSWIYRNRVLKRGSEDWKYVHLPVVKAPRETQICEMRIDDGTDWRDALLRNLDYYRDAHAPNYRETLNFLASALAPRESHLSSFLTGLLAATCRHVGVETRIDRLSALDLELAGISHPGDWALRIAEALGAKSYINAPGGTELFDRSRFDSAGIDLCFLVPRPVPYSQGRRAFVADLSILDALMWNPRESVHDMILSFDLVR